MKILMAGLLVMGALVGRGVHAQATASDIEAKLKDKNVYLRGGWGDKKLEFDGNGEPQKKYATLSFTESGFTAKSVGLNGNSLKIEGQRFGLKFDPKGEMSIVAGKAVAIEIHVAPGADLQKAVDKIFAPDLAALVPNMPVFWQPYAQQHFLPHDAKKDDSGFAPYMEDLEGGQAFFVGGDVQAPKPLTEPEPQYSETALAAKYSAKVMVYFIVDAQGKPTNLRLFRPAGLGLDERAIASVAHYTFSPAVKDGKPVRVHLSIDVAFTTHEF